jgi:hypothetical protein
MQELASVSIGAIRSCMELYAGFSFIIRWEMNFL